ncbi:MAG TPA: glycosylhydrolase-like jelly roll fold domain-containing protein, partial [Opitutaceae bacterium]
LKQLCDDFFLSGVNRIMWHGTTYSPPDAPWPGWCFYASTEMNPRTALWHDAPALNAYLTRVQSLLQSGRPDNDVLVYWPIHDLWRESDGGNRDLVKAITTDSREWFSEQPIGQTAGQLWLDGYAFDYVSDKLLQSARAANRAIQLGESSYRAIVVPPCVSMPLQTMQKLRELADAGVIVIFEDLVPRGVPGLHNLEKQQTDFHVAGSHFAATSSAQIDFAIAKANVRREQALTSHEGVRYIRRAVKGGIVYFISNRGTKVLDEPIAFASPVHHAAILDPMTGRAGLAETTDGAVRLQLDPGETILVRTFEDALPANGASWKYRAVEGKPIELEGTWTVKFVDGGPGFPKAIETSKLASWTTLGDGDTRRFAGTALYRLSFDAPDSVHTHRWLLNLGDVIQSARVRLNGQDFGTVFAPPYRVEINGLKPKDNVLEIEVTGTSANRIRDLDTRGVKWKIFYDINMVNKAYKPFDAASWPIADQGLLGPVTVQAQATN